MQDGLKMMGQNSLQELLGDIGDGVILTDPEERVLYLNGAARSILSCSDLTRRNLFFKDICPLVNLSNGKVFESPLQQAMREKKPIGLARDVGIIGSHGAIYLSATCSPIYGREGRLKGCSVMLRDVTHLRRLEMKLETNHIYMRSVFEAAKIGLCVLNADGEIIDLNNAVMEAMDVGYRDVIGLQFGDAFQCENSFAHGCGHGPECRHCPIRKNLEAAIMDDDFTGEFTVAMYSVRSKAKKLVWLNVFVSQIFLEHGKQIIVALIDISQRKQREKELELARLEAEAVSRARGQFMATMSHELRTPINGMVGMLDLVLRSEVTPQQRDNLQSAKKCAEDLQHIVNDILDFSKLESGHMQLEERGMDLHVFLRDILKVYAKMAHQKGLLFCWPDIEKLPRFIKGDALRLRQVIRNLLMNALKFTYEGTILVHAEVGKRKGQKTLEISVHDTGVGIPMEAVPNLFQPFRQVDGSITREFGGTGLGLMIVHELIEAMHGKVYVHTIPCKGCTFGFWIPLVLSDQAEETGREKAVFLNPRMMEEGAVPDTVKISENETDIAALMRYCEEKLED